jgi:hypothetical protein
MAKSLGFREVRPVHCSCLLNTYASALGELRYWRRDPEGVTEAKQASEKVELLAKSLAVFGLTHEAVKPKLYTPPNTALRGAELDRVILNPLKLGAKLTVRELIAHCLCGRRLSGVKTQRQRDLVSSSVQQRLKHHVENGLIKQTGEHYQVVSRQLSR